MPYAKLPGTFGKGCPIGSLPSLQQIFNIHQPDQPVQIMLKRMQAQVYDLIRSAKTISGLGFNINA